MNNNTDTYEKNGGRTKTMKRCLRSAQGTEDELQLPGLEGFQDTVELATTEAAKQQFIISRTAWGLSTEMHSSSPGSREGTVRCS